MTPFAGRARMNNRKPGLPQKRRGHRAHLRHGEPAAEPRAGTLRRRRVRTLFAVTRTQAVGTSIC
jgi:hypothetical protein